MAEPTLAGRTVVVTRPEGQARDLVEMLHARGAAVVAVPLIEIVPLDCADELDAAIGALTEHDWVVVASVNAADVFTATRSFALSTARVAAVGPTTARHLTRVDLVPLRNSAAGLVEEFADGRGRAVVLQAQGGAPTLIDGLSAKGWQVRRVDTHVSRPVLPTAAEQQSVLEADAVVFTSGSQARSWADVLGDAAPPVVVAIGPQTAADARRAGLRVSAVADVHSLAGVVSALEGALAR